MENLVPSSFLNETSESGLDEYYTRMEIVDNKTMVSETNVEYRFTIYPRNDVPRKAKMYVGFP